MMSGEPSQHHWHGVLDSALDAVGHTPLIRLQKLAKQEGFKCNLMAKCEFFSAGGSVKDRIAKRMAEHAERSGVLTPGQSVVIEPTSGNTGIGLALACAIKGYRCIITLPAKMSLEKEVMLKALGAVIVRTPTEAAWDSPESHIGVAKALQKSIPHAVILDQYSNPHNPLAHYHTTYPEIAYALETSQLPRKDIALLVAGAGTGGTITGLARAVRDSEQVKRNPSSANLANLKLNMESAPTTIAAEQPRGTKIVAVDPVGSILGGGEPGNYEVEGIGYDFFPEVLDRTSTLIDDWIKTEDAEAFAATKRLIREEGLFVGGSSGSALSGCIRYLHSPAGQSIANDPDANVVVILPDGVRNYMSKPWFLDQADEPGTAAMRQDIERIIGRPLGKPSQVVQHAEAEGKSLQNGDGVVIGGGKKQQSSRLPRGHDAHTPEEEASEPEEEAEVENKSLKAMKSWLEDNHSASDADIVARLKALAA